MALGVSNGQAGFRVHASPTVEHFGQNQNVPKHRDRPDQAWVGGEGLKTNHLLHAGEMNSRTGIKARSEGEKKWAGFRVGNVQLELV